MEQFKHLSIKWFNKSASDSKTVVKTVASDFKSTIQKLSTLERWVLTGVALWIILLIVTFTVLKPEVISEPDYIEPVPIDTEHIA